MKVRCQHIHTSFLKEPWPTGETIEVCQDCGMSQAHWEWGETGWVMIKDIEKARKELQESIDRILEGA